MPGITLASNKNEYTSDDQYNVVTANFMHINSIRRNTMHTLAQNSTDHGGGYLFLFTANHQRQDKVLTPIITSIADAAGPVDGRVKPWPN